MPNNLAYHINRLMKPGGKVIINNKNGCDVLNAEDFKVTPPNNRQQRRALERKEKKGKR